MNILQSVRDTLHPGSRPAHPYKLKKLDYEWSVGYEWYMSRIEGNVILDGGCLAHFEYDKILAHLGYTVIGVDIADPQEVTDKIIFIQSTVWDIPVENPVDTVLCNSLFEHLGLPHYGQTVITDGDFKTAEEFYRLLRPGGALLMQVPYGGVQRIIHHKGQPFYRIYDSTRLQELLYGLFEVEESDFYMREGRNWIKISVDIANRIDYKEGLPPCLVYVKARKR